MRKQLLFALFIITAAVITFIIYNVAIYWTVDIEMAIRRLTVHYFSLHVSITWLFEITWTVHALYGCMGVMATHAYIFPVLFSLSKVVMFYPSFVCLSGC